jgi:hypothetical protein
MPVMWSRADLFRSDYKYAKPHHSDKYSRLSVLARRYLAVPSTSVPSERIFSAAGLIVTKLRIYCVRFKKLQLGSMTLLFSSFLFIISKFYISTIIVQIQLNDNKFRNINLLFTTQYKLFTYQVMSCHIHDCYSVIVVQSFC